MKNFTIFIVTVSLAYTLSLVDTPVAHSTVSKDRSNMPITIKSNEMSADNKGKIAVFIGKVVAKQGDITILADKITINYGDQKGEVEKVEADGNVRIIQDKSTGIASHAVYESREGRMILTGNPRVMQGKDTISGVVITCYVDEDRCIVSGEANVTIQPPARKVNEAPH